VRSVVLLLLSTVPALADTVFPVRTIRAHEIIGPADLALEPVEIDGALVEMDGLIGLEARVTLYPGRPIHPGDVGPAAVVERNSVIPLIYMAGGLTITTEGRALDRAGAGDVIRVMNLGSRSTVSARIGLDGAGYVAF
jgi:flagella basal body P-ring formation protein FlgA